MWTISHGAPSAFGLAFLWDPVLASGTKEKAASKYMCGACCILSPSCANACPATGSEELCCSTVSSVLVLRLVHLCAASPHSGTDYRGSDTKGSDTRGSDPVGSDTRGSDPCGNGGCKCVSPLLISTPFCKHSLKGPDGDYCAQAAVLLPALVLQRAVQLMTKLMTKRQRAHNLPSCAQEADLPRSRSPCDYTLESAKDSVSKHHISRGLKGAV